MNNIKREKENPFNRSFEIWRKIVYSKHPYAFNASGYEEDISKLLYEDVLLEYDNFRLREKYIISNNLEIKQSFPEFHKIKFKRTKSIKKINTTNKENRFISAHNKTNQMILC